MIDPLDEELYPLHYATRFIPKRRGGKKCHDATLHRWVVDGCRGVKLEYMMVGGTRCTSREAIRRFFEKLTIGSGTPKVATPKRRQKDIDTAKLELEAAGY